MSDTEGVVRPTTMTEFPIPNIKKVVLSVLKPELKAMTDVVQDELVYVRGCVNDQNETIARLQSSFIQQSDLLVEQITKLSETTLRLITVEDTSATKVDVQGILASLVIMQNTIDALSSAGNLNAEAIQNLQVILNTQIETITNNLSRINDLEARTVVLEEELLGGVPE